MKFKPIYIIYGSIVLTGIIGVLVLVRKLTPYKKNIVKRANEEWARFGYDTSGKDGKKIKTGAKEYDEGFWQRVGDYWREALGKRYTGKDRDVAWSSAFISWVMAKSGGLFGIPFKKSFIMYFTPGWYVKSAILCNTSPCPPTKSTGPIMLGTHSHCV